MNKVGRNTNNFRERHGFQLLACLRGMLMTLKHFRLSTVICLTEALESTLPLLIKLFTHNVRTISYTERS